MRDDKKMVKQDIIINMHLIFSSLNLFELF